VETSGLPRRLEGPVDYIRVSPKEPRPERTRQDWGLELSVVYTGAEDSPAWEGWENFCIAGQELFVGDTPREVIARA
jgi:hypothetical protein